MIQKRCISFVLLLGVLACNAFAQQPTQINVEIDWMDLTGPGGHSHRPTNAEINAVVQMFACQGVTLNVDISNSVAHINVLRRDPSNVNNFFGYTGTDSYGSIKAANFNHSGGGWHYCIFAHQYEDENHATTTSSGLANYVGDFIVTLGAFNNNIGTDWDRAATFAHELGHNLGLSHSGSMDEATSGPYVPNLPSVMSYFFQLTGVRNNLECQGLVPKNLTLFKNLDYSHGISCALDENALREGFGMGIKQVDWDCNSKIEGTISHDLSNDRTTNGWCSANGTKSVLVDYNEWANIRDVTNLSPAALAKMSLPKMVSCITYEEQQTYVNRAAICAQPTVTSESCTNNRMIYVNSSSTFPFPFGGTCSVPYRSIQVAYNNADNGDIIYFAPGNYGVPSTGITLDKRAILAGPGNITIGKP